MSVKEFLRRNWVSILAIIIGISGIVLAYYFHRVSIARREPVFLIDPARTRIMDSKSFSETPLRIVRADGSQIKGDITSVRFYF